MFWRSVSHISSRFALFLANETTVQVARVALPRVLPAQWLNLPKIVQKRLEK